MPRLPHGTFISLQQVETARAAAVTALENLGLPPAVAPLPDLSRFDFLFPALQGSPDNLLPEGSDTAAHLRRLGASMQEVQPAPGTDSQIPAAYTYLGQFIDHDVTLEAASDELRGGLGNPNVAPLPLDEILNGLRNTRTATLDLDSVYGAPAPQNGDKMVVGTVSVFGGRPPGKDDFNDLSREGRSNDEAHDRAALIGDPRNDENLIVAQLHVAFLRAHNAVVDSGRSFAEARTLLRQHYQDMVLHDFLKRIVEPQLVDDILRNGNRFYRTSGSSDRPFYLPLEFTVAAYRFGHSMVRHVYNHNDNFPAAPLAILFTFTALSGNLNPAPGVDFETLPENWIILWERFVEHADLVNLARPIDTTLVEPLFALRNLQGQTLPGDSARLAVRNLLRGYLLRIPTGQAVARAMGATPLTAAELEAVAAAVPAVPGGEAQADVLRDAGFLERTPLWYYVLAEAAHGGQGRLGPVGGAIVAEVLIELVRRSEDSILAVPGWTSSLGNSADGHFGLVDLLRLGGVLPPA
jgi:hypothetical protein